MKFKSLAASIMCCMAATAFAQNFVVDGIAYNRISDTEAAVTQGSEFGIDYTGEIVIPSQVTHDGITYNIVAIERESFYQCFNLRSVFIPESVTKIGDYAFQSSGVTELSISDSVTIVGASAIGNTPYYDNMPYGVIYLGSALYDYKGNMPENTSFVVKDGTKSITDDAFRGQNNLISITLPKSIIHIGWQAFFECINLASINIPDGVKSIENCAFEDCKSLTSIDLPNSVTFIGANAFNGCTSLTSINIPEGVTSIENYTFCGCTNLASIDLPDGITSIGIDAFSCCGNLKSITIPDAVKTIGEAAFFDCTSLTSINIPDGVTSINDGAFYGCIGLQHIYSLNEEPAYCGGQYVFTNVPVETCVLHVPAGCVEAYQAADGWKDFQNIVGDQAGIEDVTTDDAPAEYFDLRGMKVTDPSNGIFIKKQGNSTSKIKL